MKIHFIGIGVLDFLLSKFWNDGIHKWSGINSRNYRD